MSTDSRNPDENRDVNQPAGQNSAEQRNLPVPREALPPNREELSEEKRQRLEELAERANTAHNLAKDAAVRFCRHSIEAGMALLEAQGLCPKRAWGAWLADHFDWSERTAFRYMHEAKLALLMGGKMTDLAFFHPEELVRLMNKALYQIERQHAAAAASSEATTNPAVKEESTPVVEAADAPPRLSDDGDLLAKASALFDELLAVLRRATESGQALDYGQFVLDELERIRGDLEVCRLLIRDAHLGASAAI
jgi:hypothetical protein